MKKQGTLYLKAACPSWVDQKLNDLIDEGNEIVQAIPVGNFDSNGSTNWMIIYNIK